MLNWGSKTPPEARARNFVEPSTVGVLFFRIYYKSKKCGI